MEALLHASADHPWPYGHQSTLILQDDFPSERLLMSALAPPSGPQTMNRRTPRPAGTLSDRHRRKSPQVISSHGAHVAGQGVVGFTAPEPKSTRYAPWRQQSNARGGPRPLRNDWSWAGRRRPDHLTGFPLDLLRPPTSTQGCSSRWATTATAPAEFRDISDGLHPKAGGHRTLPSGKTPPQSQSPRGITAL